MASTLYANNPKPLKPDQQVVTPIGRPSPSPGGGGASQQSSRGGGGGIGPTGNFGLNLNDPTAFDPFASPATQGQFNREVLQSAQPQYMPQLQQIGGDIWAENRATGQRRNDLRDIYNTYGQQARQAFQDTQAALNALIQANAGGDAASQANLAAALRAASGGSDQLRRMVGMGPEAAGSALPYETAAGAAGTATAGDLKGIAAGLLGFAGTGEANAALERSSQFNTESLRHQGALQGYRQQREALIQQIPGIIEKAREQMITQLLNSQNLKFQQNLATKQFNLSSAAQTFNQNLATKQFNAQQSQNAITNAQNQQALDQKAQADKAATQAAIAKAGGQAQVNAIQYFSNFIAPTKQEITKVKDPTTGVTSEVITPHWHRDVGSALRSLMGLYGMNLDQALQIMEDVGGNTFISGNGGQTIAEWAYTYKQRKASGGLGGGGGTGGSLFGQPLR